MATCILVRHGRSTANTAGVLAGWMPGVRLDEEGRRQARAAGERLAGVRLAALVASPVERCRETALAVLAQQATGPHAPLSLTTDDDLGECRYGGWTGRALAELAQEPEWDTVQWRPAQARFPDDDRTPADLEGAPFPAESLAEMERRAVAAVLRRDAEIEQEHGPGAVWCAVSHGDVIKAVLAHAVGAGLEHFQRVVVEPASVSAVRFTAQRPFLLRLNDTGALDGLAPAAAEPATGEAAVGGGA